MLNLDPASCKARATVGIVGVALLTMGLGAAQAAPMLTTCSAEVPLQGAACRVRAASLLQRDGYSDATRTADGWRAASADHSVAITCFDSGQRSIASVAVAGESEAAGECARLARALEQGDPPKHLAVEVAGDGRVVLRWNATPGDDSDWITVQPARSADDRYDLFWTYVGRDRSGTRVIGPLDSGAYEARLYVDWPNGGYVVRERLAFRVPPH